MLDGESIEIDIKNKTGFFIGFDGQCLFSTKFEKNSFPYKLQYDFSKIFHPIDYSFEKMYAADTCGVVSKAPIVK